jgi:hypothetical protein
LVAVLEDFAAPPNGIYAVSPAQTPCRCGYGCGSILNTTTPSPRFARRRVDRSGLQTSPTSSQAAVAHIISTTPSSTRARTGEFRRRLSSHISSPQRY